jgi:2-polyprenyl-3-methyl-5-hydroxy-6-metoxy-1,4-benzoquinol methylase
LLPLVILIFRDACAQNLNFVAAARVHLSFMTNSNQLEKSIAGRAADWAAVARTMALKGETEKAYKLAMKIRSMAPNDPETVFLVSEVLSGIVPDWHFGLVRDEVRNAAFDAALRRAIKPGMRVLDIGSGTGLLAMMAARAGASQVFSCEMNPAVADAAKEIVAANGFSDQIQVLPRHSNQLDADKDLGGRVDLIVSEIVSNDMLGQRVLATMDHAVVNLLKPDGLMIPAKGSVKVALGFDSNLQERRMAVTDGFDLTAFNRFADPCYCVRTTSKYLQLLSEAADLFEFDFQSATPVPAARKQLTLIARGGPVNCVVQWIHLEMDEVGVYENRLGAPTYSTWAIVAYPLSTQGELKAGNTIIVNGSHNRERLRIWTSLE